MTSSRNSSGGSNPDSPPPNPADGAGEGEASGERAPTLNLLPSDGFTGWLAGAGFSVAVTTYQAGKLLLVGSNGDRLSIFERTFNRPMGLGVGPGRFWMSSLYQLWRFEAFVEAGAAVDGHDQLFVPTVGHTTGDIDIHDINEDADGRPIFAATRFNCLATTSERSSFRAIWRPPFIDALVPEDRCHLNGVAMRDGAPAFVTCLAASNEPDGWRTQRRDGGCIIDVASGELVAEGLSMPHSPRLHKDELWLNQAGTGEFGRLDLSSGRFEPICFLPGFARGLSIIGDHAIIGLSRPRGEVSFTGLPLDESLKEGEAKCGICAVNLKTGALDHRLDIEGVIEEIYDVAVLEGVVRPMAVGFRNDEIRYVVRPEEG